MSRVVRLGIVFPLAAALMVGCHGAGSASRMPGVEAQAPTTSVAAGGKTGREGPGMPWGQTELEHPTQDGAFVPSVREVDSTTYTGSSISEPKVAYYYLYLGNQATLKSDAEFNDQPTAQLVHSLFDMTNGVEPLHTRCWFATFPGDRGGVGTPEILQSRATWDTVPTEARHVLVALGVDDQELLVIACRLYSKSVSIFFDPRYDRDRNFYEQKLDLLAEYLKTHDARADVPFG